MIKGSIIGGAFAPKERVVIIGGAGFIGTHLGNAMIELGYQVSSVDTAYDPDNLKYRQFTKAYPNLLEEATIIIHLASVVGVSNVENDPMGTIATNYDTVKDILPYCDGTRKVLYSSTSEVYGDNADTQEFLSIRLDNIDNVRSSYKISKILGEHMILSHGGVVIRPFNVTGVGQNKENAVIPKMVRDALKNNVIEVYDRGRQVRAFMSIGDAVDSILHILDTHDFKNTDKGLHDGIYNVGNPLNEISMLDLAVNIQDKIPTAKIREVIFSNVHPKSFEIYTRVPNIYKLGLTFTDNLGEIIDEIIEDQTNGE